MRINQTRRQSYFKKAVSNIQIHCLKHPITQVPKDPKKSQIRNRIPSWSSISDLKFEPGTSLGNWVFHSLGIFKETALPALGLGRAGAFIRVVRFYSTRPDYSVLLSSTTR